MEWYHYVIMLIGGGAAGAIITTIVSSRRNRIQPILKNIQVINVFDKHLTNTSFETFLTVLDNDKEYKFDNLFIASIDISNIGNKDYENFSFGITMPIDYEIIKVELSSKDRHHVIESLTEVSLKNPSTLLDISLTPFNRKDKYYLLLHYVLSNNVDPTSDIVLSSSHPIKFVEPAQVSIKLGEFVGAVALGMASSIIKR